MDLHRTMHAQQAPDVYAGKSCEGIAPRWIGSAEGDKDGPGEVGTDGVISLSARTFPPGTIVEVREPMCPQCGEVPHDAGDLPDGHGGWFTHWKCGCDFDWRKFALDTYL